MIRSELRHPVEGTDSEPESLPEYRGYPRFRPVGDTALTVEFGDMISPQVNEAVVTLDVLLAAAEIDGIIETVPSYRSLMICYEPLEISFKRLVTEVRRLVSHGDRMEPRGWATWTVPVLYGPPGAEDLKEVTERLSLAEHQVIALHSGAEYRVYAIGFAPGLPYLGGLPPALRISRREAPRPSVPAGAVMIGGIQAAIVPISMPSAWYSLGRTPLRLFDLGCQDPFPFHPGDRVRFRPIHGSEFEFLASLKTDALLPLVRSSP